MRTPVRRCLRLCLVLASLVCCYHTALGEDAAKPDQPMGKDRVALIIGNGDYSPYPRLANPANDARAMAQVLADIGFEIYGGEALVDLDKKAMEDAIRGFGHRIKDADIALFYYAGHGIQVNDKNYMVPIKEKLDNFDYRDIKYIAVEINDVLEFMKASDDKASDGKLNIVILDACRNNPFGEHGVRGISGRVGLAQMVAPSGTLIAYATAPGRLAKDGAGDHSPYTLAMLQTLKKPGLKLSDAFIEIARRVQKETNGEQNPWMSLGPITSDFYFIEPAAATTGVLSLAVSPADAEAKLKLDGAAKGLANGFREELGIGAHEYEITASGFEKQQGTINIQPGNNSIVMTLASAAKPPPPPPPRRVTGALELDVTPPEAVLKLDGVAVGPAKGFRQELRAGPHRVELSARGYETYAKTVILSEGVDDAIVIDLRPIAAAPPPPPLPETGTLALQVATPGATVRLDGEPAGLAKGFRRQIKAGDHEIEIAANGFEPSRQKIAIAAGAETSVVLTLAAVPKPAPSPPPNPDKKTGFLTVTAEPVSASIKIDGKPVGSPGSAQLVIAPGNHVVTAGGRGWVEQRLSVHVNAGERVQVPLQLSRQARSPAVAARPRGVPPNLPAASAAPPTGPDPRPPVVTAIPPPPPPAPGRALLPPP